jgi:23S rRNA pseudouridine1911/1915/1917 synthase
LITLQHSFQVDADDFPKSTKVRLDAYLATKLPQTSRARLQASIKGGLITVNGSPQSKASYVIKHGDVVHCSVLPPPPLEAAPEPLPLDIVFEDEHVIVVNKNADMVMHPSPGHYTGTMVNALLFHCGLPSVKLAATMAASAEPPSASGSNSTTGTGSDGIIILGVNDSEIDDDDDDEDDVGIELLLGNQLQQEMNGDATSSTSSATPQSTSFSSSPSSLSSVGSDTHVIRPGIVHRLDKGTTGLVVVAKTDLAHLSLCGQFKDRSIGRAYYALTLGVPQPSKGRVETNIGRDFRDRKKMAAFEFCSTRGRNAASNYKVLETLAGGRAALVEWRLETGRTHQIRVHSKYIGHPLIADETYSGGSGAAVSVLGGGKATRVAATHAVLKMLARPALHAKTLQFDHPVTGERLQFDSELPDDFKEALDMLKNPTQF